MSTLQMKQQVAQAALKYILPDMVIGIGTGSTVNCLIELLAQHQHLNLTTIASSNATEKLLKQANINVVDFNTIAELSLYIDGADSYNSLKQLVKGGGGAMTREKILAYHSQQFICIVDASKKTEFIGKFPIPIEVLPMARSAVAREIVKLHGKPVWRSNFITDNGNQIIDVHDWQLNEPIAMETKLNNIPGVVSNGIFALRGADKILVGTENNLVVL